MFKFFILFVLVAFIFNWIGFLLLMCFCHTIASRYGALSGFGLSLAKWTFIVQHSTELASKDNSWLWWLIMTFGEYFKLIVYYSNIHTLQIYLPSRLSFHYNLKNHCFRPYNLHSGYFTISQHQERLAYAINQSPGKAPIFLLRALIVTV